LHISRNQGPSTSTSPPPPAPEGGVGSAQQKTAVGGSAANRTAGDVLNDIGSMLADLTDELDAMLQLERNALFIYAAILFNSPRYFVSSHGAILFQLTTLFLFLQDSILFYIFIIIPISLL
jgi:hypothetical protein